MFQNPNVLLDFSNYGPVDDWTQVTVMALFLLFVICFPPLICCDGITVSCLCNVLRRDKSGR